MGLTFLASICSLYPAITSLIASNAAPYLTTTITVTDSDRGRVEDKVRQVERIVNGLGFTTIREGVNAVEAWLSSLPGPTYANVRQPLIHTLKVHRKKNVAVLFAT